MPLGNNPDEYDSVLVQAGGNGGGMFESVGTAQLLQMGSSVIGRAMAGGGSSARSDNLGRNDISNDFSGWNVNFGGGNIDSNRDQASTSWGLYVVMAVGALILVKALKK